MRLKNIVNQIYSPITLIVGKDKFEYLEKTDYIILSYYDHQIIGIRAQDDNVIISLKEYPPRV